MVLHFGTVAKTELMTQKCFAYYRNTDLLRLEGTSGGHPVQPHCSSRATYSQLRRNLSRQLLNISMDRYTTMSLGNL